MIVFHLYPARSNSCYGNFKAADKNRRDFTRALDKVHYYPQPVDVKVEGFFADGIHPSEQGYSDWAEAMMKHFDSTHKW